MPFARSAFMVGITSLMRLAPAGAQPPSAVETAVAEVDGIATRYHVAGLAKRSPSTPIVVFFSGSFAPLEVWRGVLSRLDDTIPRLAYDRPGAGRSAPIDGMLTPARASGHLAALLKQLDIAPPFVVVGWSWGGPLALDFAARHPGSVVGSVFLDPTVTALAQSVHRTMLIELGATPADVDSYFARQEQELPEMLASLPAGVRSEIAVVTAIADTLNLPFPRVPTTVLLAGRMQPGFTRGTLPAGVDEGAFFRAERLSAQETLQARLRDVPATVLRVLPQSAHSVPSDDPEAVVQEIMRVLRLRGR